MAQPTTNVTRKEWKIYIAQIIIGVIGIVDMILRGDGNVLTAVIVAEGTLGGVALSQ